MNGVSNIKKFHSLTTSRIRLKDYFYSKCHPPQLNTFKNPLGSKISFPNLKERSISLSSKKVITLLCLKTRPTLIIQQVFGSNNRQRNFISRVCRLEKTY